MHILHIAKTGYDEGLVEALVEKLEIPAKVAYLGPEAHTDALWTAYTERKGALVYSYFPNANQHGISILSLERAAIAPGDDFQSQQLQNPCLVLNLWFAIFSRNGVSVTSLMRGCV